MKALESKDDFFVRQSMKLLCKDEVCSVYQMKNESGDGTLTAYHIYPGIEVMYNDFHMASCPSRKYENDKVITIHHCLEGRIEWEVCDGAFLYLAPDDIMMENSAFENRQCNFPLNHYHGITITISVSELQNEMTDLLRFFSIDLENLEQHFELNAHPFIMHKASAIKHLAHEMYDITASIRMEYLRIKVIEMLVILRTIDAVKFGEDHPYFYRTQVDKIKAIMALITENLDEHFTMNDLSARFDISVSALKQCFKGVYGTAIYTYIRNYRMDMAATLLTQTDEPITTIAGKVGYSNSSKFSQAFKSIKGKSPLEYRKITT